MDYKAAAQASDGDGWTLALRRAALGGQRLNVATHTHTLTQLLGERQVRERCLGDESVKHYSSGVWGSPGVEGRLTGWVIRILLRREEGRGRRGARDEGWGGGTERWRWGHTHSHTEQCTLVYCVCLRQWQSVYHVAINLPTITLWCPGWRPQTGVSLTPAHFVSWLCLCPPLLTLPRPLPFAKTCVGKGVTCSTLSSGNGVRDNSETLTFVQRASPPSEYLGQIFQDKNVEFEFVPHFIWFNIFSPDLCQLSSGFYPACVILYNSKAACF